MYVCICSWAYACFDPKIFFLILANSLGINYETKYDIIIRTSTDAYGYVILLW